MTHFHKLSPLVNPDSLNHDDSSGRPKRRMTEFTLEEISAVDEPAQRPARAVIRKRASPVMTLEQLQDGAASLQKKLEALIQKQHATKEADMTTFIERVDHIEKRDGCSRLLALTKARREFPQEYEAHQSEGIAFEKAAEKTVVEKAAVGGCYKRADAFSLKVDEIHRAEKCSRTDAMERARHRFPAEFADYAAS
jgi:hypothetical protein